jgi:hypothetical protein
MAQTPAQRRANQRAQRATARRIKESRKPGRTYRTVLPKSIIRASKKAQTDYANYMLAHPDERPPKRSAEGDQLARMAALSYWNKADPSFLEAFKQYFYHDELKKASALNDEEDEEDE